MNSQTGDEKTRLKHTIRRPFTILDGMTAVAALAASLGLLKGFGFDSGWNFYRTMWTDPAWFFDSWMLDRAIVEFFIVTETIVFCLTIATLVYRLRRPRPRWRRLACQPGMSAVLSATLACILILPLFFAIVPVQGTAEEVREYLLGQSVTITPAFAGFGVACRWGLLLLAGRWRCERSWIDRLGRIAGVGWICLSVWAIYLRFIC